MQANIEEHSKREKTVMTFFNEAVNEVKACFFVEGCERVVGIRVQTIIAFTFVEVLSNFWDCYVKGQNSPNDRIAIWLNTFCMTNENIIYKNNPYFKNLGVEPILDLRNSLIHFFGMSQQKVGKEITLCSSDISDVAFEKFKSRFDKNIAVLKPINFYELFKEGGLLMMKKMIDNINISNVDENKKREHIEGIARIFEKFEAEGAMQIIIPKLNVDK